MKTRFEEILQPLNVQERLAISAALFIAEDNEAEFKRRFGTYGWECLMKIMKPK